MVWDPAGAAGTHSIFYPRNPVSGLVAWAWELVDVLFTVEAREEEGRGGPTLGGQAGGRSPAAVLPPSR